MTTAPSVDPISKCFIYSLLCCFRDCMEMNTSLSPSRVVDKRPWLVYQTRRVNTVENVLDPLQWDQKMPIQTAQTLFDFAEHIRNISDQITSPIKIVHGVQDGFLPVAGSVKLAKSVAYGRDKKLGDILWKLPEEKHLVLSGNYGEEIAEDIGSWLAQMANKTEHLTNPVV